MNSVFIVLTENYFSATASLKTRNRPQPILFGNSIAGTAEVFSKQMQNIGASVQVAAEPNRYVVHVWRALSVEFRTIPLEKLTPDRNRLTMVEFFYRLDYTGKELPKLRDGIQ
jgi:hypothetical protein